MLNIHNKIVVSIIVINFNGSKYVRKCVNSIFESKTPNLEVIVVDNGSIDNSLAILNTFKQIKNNTLKIIALKKNFGPSYARNQGVKIARGKYIGFLDNDTIVDKQWARESINVFEQNNRLGVIQCKLLLNKERNKIDYVGEYIGQNGFLIQTAQAGEIDKNQYNKPSKILAAKSAGMFIRKDVFNKIRGFDEDYFIYVEETDLGWRVWLAGYECRYIPKSIVYHEFGTSTIILGKNQSNYNAKFNGCKNYILTLIKNLSFINLIKILPLHIILWEGLAIYILLRGEFKNFFWINKGILWNFVSIKHNLQKRKFVQKNRKVSDAILFPIIMKKRSFLYFLKKGTIKHKVGNAESF